MLIDRTVTTSPIIRTTCEQRSAWLLQTRHAAMLVSVTGGGALLLDHWGGKGQALDGDAYLPRPPKNRPSRREFLDGVPLAYAVHGEPSFKEPCLYVAYPDGSRGTRLALRDDRIDEAARSADLTLVFADELTDLLVEHRFTVHVDHDVIVRGTTVTNAGERPVRLEQAASAAVSLPPGSYDAWTLHGQWGGEFQLERRRLQTGKFVTESRQGYTSQEATPWFAVTPAGAAAPDEAEAPGPVWFGALGWSGNWSIVFESERNDAVHIVAGIQPFDFAWHLEPGERFETPPLACGYTDGGMGEASRLLHRYENAELLPQPGWGAVRPVHYNSWFTSYFDVDARGQMALARRAADLGAELFVIDDGWFGARDTDHAGLGDWVVNKEKFPNGLGELIDEVGGLGMRFGIWVEPEMVNPDSDLYRAHPDWTLHIPGREPTMVRDQLVLNFARADVRAEILGQLRRLLRDHRIDFLKWDHNRPYTEAGWPDAPAERQREVWVRHVRGVYEILAQLRSEFPDLLIETCAGGGGRVDLGILGLTDQAWPSDNTDPADRLHIQYGYSRAYPARTMANWVTDTPDVSTGRHSPLEFRFHVAMQGVLGLSSDILGWDEEECRAAGELIDAYKRIRPIVQEGDQFWLEPPSGDGPCAVQYVSPDRRETALLMYQVRGVVGAGLSRFRLRGLDPDRAYRRVSDGVQSAGAALMAAGLPFEPPAGAESQHSGDWHSRLEIWTADDHGS